MANSVIQSVEIVSLTGAGSSLGVTESDVRSMTSDGVLYVVGGAGTTLRIESDWFSNGTTTDSGVTFNVYGHGQATLNVQSTVTVDKTASYSNGLSLTSYDAKTGASSMRAALRVAPKTRPIAILWRTTALP